jgi:hypothetical protein
MTNEEAAILLEEFAAKLGEHFDAVQIMVSWNIDNQSKCLKRGCGNWYARQGMAHEFINEDIAQENAHQIASRLNPPEDDSEDYITGA